MLTDRIMIAPNGITKVRGVTIEAIALAHNIHGKPVYRGNVIIDRTVYNVEGKTPKAKTWHSTGIAGFTM